MRRLIVIALERACFALDHPRIRGWLPWPLTRLACPAGMARWSSELDERWHTGVWEAREDADDIRAAREALAEPGPPIPWEQVKTELEGPDCPPDPPGAP